MVLDTSSNLMLTQIVLWLNSFATSMASIVLAPIAWLPGWLSATLIAVVTGSPGLSGAGKRH